MECELVLEPELERLLHESQEDYDAILHESLMDSSNAEIELKERELALLRKSIEDHRIKREAEANRIQTLEKLIDDRSKSLEAKEKQVSSIKRQLSSYCRHIDAKEREYRAIRQSIDEGSIELVAMGEELKSVQKQIGECERSLRLKEEECNWQLETMHQLISERDGVHKKMQRAIEACGADLGAKESRLRMVDGLIREREQELEAKDVEVQNIHRNCEWKEKELRELSARIADCNKELRAREEELDSRQRLIDGEGKELEFRRRNLLKSMQVKVDQLVKELELNKKEFDSFRRSMKEKSTELEKKETKIGEGVKDLESMKKQFEERVKEFELKEKQYGGQGKELKAKERKFEERVKEFESKEKQFEGRVVEFESKEKQLEGQMKELKLKQKQFEEQVKEFDSKQIHFEGQMKEFKTKQKQFRGQMKAHVSEEKKLEVQEKMLQSKEKQYDGQVHELTAKENQCEVRAKELESREKEFEGQLKDLKSQKNQYEEKLKELELKEVQFRLALKKLESEEKQFEGRLKDLQSKQNELGRKQKELELKEKRCKSFEEGQVLKEKSNILLHQVKAEPQDFTVTNSVNNCKNLQLLFNLLENYELVCSQVSDALQTSAEPSIMVLVTINGFCSPQSRQELSECDANFSRRVRNLLMDELKKSSPVISSHVKQEAIKFASDWKASIAAADTDCLEVLDFLKFVATYEIGSSFTEHELRSLLDTILQHCQAPQALRNIEKLPDNQISPTTTDGGNLQLLSNEPELIGNDILACLQTSADPATLVLDMIQNPTVPQNRKGNDDVIIDGSHIILLDQLLRISPSLQIKPPARDAAKKLATDLKANMNPCDENSLEVLGFLLLLSIYGLVSYFYEDEVFKLFEFAAQHKQAIELFRTLGFADKIDVFVQNLVDKKKFVDAARFICAYKLAYKENPVDLLRFQILRANRIFGRSAKNKSIEEKVRNKELELGILGKVLQCISDNNLGSEDLVNEIQDRILVLEREKEGLLVHRKEREELGRLVSKLSSTLEVHNNNAFLKNQVQQPEEKISADGAVTENLVKVQQPIEKQSPNAAVTKNQVKVQQAEAKKPVYGVQQWEARKRANVSKKKAKKLKRMQSANGAVTMNQRKVRQPKAKKPANGAITMNQTQVQQPVVNRCSNESVTVDQEVQQSQEKKRPIEAVPDNHHLHQSQLGYDNKRPRVDASHCLPPRVFTSQYQHSFAPSGMPAQFGLPPNYYGVTNPFCEGYNGANYFGQPGPYRPFG